MREASMFREALCDQHWATGGSVIRYLPFGCRRVAIAGRKVGDVSHQG